MTTHDPLCLRGLDADEVMVFRRVARENSDGLPVVVEQLLELPETGSLTIEQILTSDLFQLFSTEDPEVEASFARAADLLALEQAGHPIDNDEDREALRRVHAEVAAQVRRGMPVGSTEVERLVQEAIELYLARRRGTRADAIGQLRLETREMIARAVENL